MCLQFGFVIFWQKNFGAKAAHKMMVKLTPGVERQKTFFFHHEWLSKIRQKILCLERLAMEENQL